jgi:molybdate transport system permease protein
VPGQPSPAGGTPLPVWVAAAMAATALAVPLIALVQRASWATLLEDLRQPAARDALRLTLVTSTAATVLAVAVGLPLAWVLARGRFPGRSVLRALVLLPIVLPPVVGGVALLAAFGPRGLVGGWLAEAADVRLTFTTAGVVVAQAYLSMPFFVLAAEAGLRSVDTTLEEVAADLGAGRWRTARTVTLPLVAPSLAAGAALAWARAVGEFGATLTFAGNVEGRTRTLPLAVYLELESGLESAIGLSLVLVALAAAVAVATRGWWSGPRR